MPKHFMPAARRNKERNAANYITRTKAVDYLQVNLATFRKLCILKGIFPREPKRTVEGNHKTYYRTKDIMFLAHEPLLHMLRILPPNLSPFVDNEAEGCVPEYAETIKRLQAAAKKTSVTMPLENQDLNVPQVLLVEGIVDMTEANEAVEITRKLMMLEKQYHDELNMELRGITYSSLANVNLDNIVDNGNEEIVTCAEEPNDLSQISQERKKRTRLKLLHERKENAEARKKP